jgi:hypothetical protein
VKYIWEIPAESVSDLFCKWLHLLCAGFKIPSWQQGEGSTPSFGISTKKGPGPQFAEISFNKPKFFLK